MEPDTRPRTYRIDEVAQLMGVSTRTVRRWLARGLLRGTRIGGIVRVVPEDVLLMVETHRIVPPAA